MSFYAIISGAGSGTGASVARLFAKKYPVVLLSRSESSYKPIVDDINSSGGKAIGIAADASDAKAIDSAFTSIAQQLPGAKLAAAVFNANAGFKISPFLDLTAEDFDNSLGTAAYVPRGSYHALPHIQLTELANDLGTASFYSHKRHFLNFSRQSTRLLTRLRSS